MNKKVMTFVVAMVLLLGVTLGVTFALMTEQTQTITNTFVAGKFGTLTLQETYVDEQTDGEVTVNGTTTAQTPPSMTVIPGKNITKKPFVDFTLDASADKDTPYYVYVKLVKTGSWALENGETHKYENNGISFEIDSAWTELNDGSDGIYYICVQNGSNITTQDIIKNGEVVVPATVTKTQVGAINGSTLVFSAYAVQQANTTDTAQSLWTAAGFGA